MKDVVGWSYRFRRRRLTTLKGVGKAAKFFKNVGDVQCEEIMILVQNDVPLLALCLSLNTLP